MSDPGPSDPVEAGIERSRRRQRASSNLWQHVYAALVTAGWLLIVVGGAVVIASILRHGLPDEIALRVLLAWIGIFGYVVMTWLFWNFAVPLYADRLSGGRFSAWRAKHLRGFDRWFSRVSLVLLLSVPLIPILQLWT